MEPEKTLVQTKMPQSEVQMEFPQTVVVNPTHHTTFVLTLVGEVSVDGSLMCSFTLYDLSTSARYEAVKIGLGDIELDSTRPLWNRMTIELKQCHLVHSVDRDEFSCTFATLKRPVLFKTAQSGGSAVEDLRKELVDANKMIIHLKEALIPSGTVVAYAGGVAPNGWHACDGTAIPRDAEFQSLRQLPLTHFPDLRKRFILGSGGGQDLNVAGGEEQVTLSIDHMPSHTHGVADPGHTHGIRRAAGSAHPGGPPWESWHGTSVNDPEYGGGQIVTNSRTNIAINNSGGNLAHNNMPPFYALMYIIKL